MNSSLTRRQFVKRTALAGATLAATGLVVSVLALLITVMGPLAGVVVAAFIGGLLIGSLITHYVFVRTRT